MYCLLVRFFLALPILNYRQTYWQIGDDRFILKFRPEANVCFLYSFNVYFLNE